MRTIEAVPETEASLNDTLGKVFGLIKRGRWWVLLPACCVALATAAVVSRLPSRYTSDTTLVVVQQQISPTYVPPESTATPTDIVQGMTRDVLSRSRLLRVVEELNLYPGAKRSDSLAERMRDEILISPVGGDFNAFKISYSADTAELAQSVTSHIASLFIEENLRTRGDQAEKTTSFLTERLEETKKKLTTQEERLKDFKLRNLGQLPEEQGVNLGALTGLRAELQNVMDNLYRAQQLRASFDAVVRGNLAGLDAEKTALLTRFTPQHPEVLKKDREILRVRSMLDHMHDGTTAVGSASGATPDDGGLSQVRGQVDANATEIESLLSSQKRLQGEIQQYQKRLDMTPIREQELVEINRDYDQNKRDYTDLLNKQLQSQLTSSLEERQQGQHFRLVDPPSLPLEPSGPHRARFLFGGIVVGLVVGLLLAFLADLKDPSFHTEKDLSALYSLPLLLSVPLLPTPRELSRRKWRSAFEVLAGSAAILAVLATEFYVYGRG